MANHHNLVELPKLNQLSDATHSTKASAKADSALRLMIHSPVTIKTRNYPAINVIIVSQRPQRYALLQDLTDCAPSGRA